MLLRLMLCLALALPATATAGDTVMHDAFARAIAIVEAHSAYREIPPVRYWVKVPAGDMPRIAIRNQAAGDHRLVVAMFVCQERAMYLSDGLDPADPDQMGIVVHEMVHHAQCEASRFTHDLCPAEREAYRIQAAYFRSLDGLANGFGAGPVDGQARAQELEQSAEYACRAARNR